MSEAITLEQAIQSMRDAFGHPGFALRGFVMVAETVHGGTIMRLAHGDTSYPKPAGGTTVNAGTRLAALLPEPELAAEVAAEVER